MKLRSAFLESLNSVASGKLDGYPPTHVIPPMPTRRGSRRERATSPTKYYRESANPPNHKRAASEAAAQVTRDEIAKLFGLSLAEAANRIGVRSPPSSHPSIRFRAGGGRETSGACTGEMGGAGGGSAAGAGRAARR